MALALFTDVIMVNLKGKSFLKLLDFSTEEIEYLINYSAELKQMKKQGVKHRFFEGKNIALLFEKILYNKRIIIARNCKCFLLRN